MCLGVPGQITEVWQEGGHIGGGPLMADVDFVGEHKRVCLDYLPELGIGDWVITHAGYALTKLTPETAASTLQTMRDVGLLEEVTLP